jgi:hypothetical protein
MGLTGPAAAGPALHKVFGEDAVVFSGHDIKRYVQAYLTRRGAVRLGTVMLQLVIEV